MRRVRRASRHGLALATAGLLAGFGTAEVASAAKPKADLAVVKVTPSKEAAAGGGLSMQVAVRNAGGRSARASTLVVLLSADRKRSKDDVELTTSERVGRLSRRRRRVAKPLLAVPRSVAAGRYHVLACADAGRRIRERDERNNCRSSKRKVLISFRLEDVAIAGPLRGDDAAGGPAGRPSPPDVLATPDPLSVTPILEPDRAVTKTVGAFSETVLTSTSANGTVSTLTMPANAVLSDVDVTMTPVARIDGLPFAQQPTGAVELKPHGLQLMEPATLTIDPPGQDPPRAGQTGFLAHDGGEDFHLYPRGPEERATLRLLHFSTTGVGPATEAERQAVMRRPPDRVEAQLEQAVADYGHLLDSTNGIPGPGWHAGMMAFFDQAIRPRLVAAETSEALAPGAIRLALAWERQLQLIGFDPDDPDGDPDYAARSAEIEERLDRILRNAVDETYRRCVQENDLHAGARMLGWYRTMALLGYLTEDAELDEAGDRYLRCARFEVDFDSTIVTSGGFTGGTQSQAYDGRFQMKAHDVLLELGTGQVPSAPLVDDGSAYEHTITYAPSNDCTLRTDISLTGVEAGVLRAGVHFDLNLYEDRPARHTLRVSVSQAPEEQYSHQNSGCSSNSTTSTGSRWGDLFGSFRDKLLVQEIELDATEQTGDLVGARTIVNERDETSPRASVDEMTQIALFHKPLR